MLLTLTKRERLGKFLSFLPSTMKFKQPAKKKKARMQGEHIKTTSLRRLVTKVKHNSQAIVSMNNGSEPTSSVTLPCLLTKSLCGLAVVHI